MTFRNPDRVAPYELALSLAGLEPVTIDPSTRRGIDGLSGLVLSGGSDINPARYGQAAEAWTGQVDDPRDELELTMTANALVKGLPVLGICRGMQILNVLHGGTLIQHLETEVVHSQPVSPQDQPGSHSMAHTIEVVAESRLEHAIGPGQHEVNSRHHQAIDRIGRGLVVSARAGDGVVEGVERKDGDFCVGVQWHPEDRVRISSRDRKLFEAFAAAVFAFGQ